MHNCPDMWLAIYLRVASRLLSFYTIATSNVLFFFPKKHVDATICSNFCKLDASTSKLLSNLIFFFDGVSMKTVYAELTKSSFFKHFSHHSSQCNLSLNMKDAHVPAALHRVIWWKETDMGWYLTATSRAVFYIIPLIPPHSSLKELTAVFKK